MTLQTAPEVNHNGTAIPEFHNYDGEYFRAIAPHGHVHPELFFYFRTKQPPSTITYENIDGMKALDSLCNYYGVNKSIALTYVNINMGTNKRSDEFMLIQVSNDIALHFNEHYGTLMVMYTYNVPKAELLHIENLVKEHVVKNTYHRLNLLVHEKETGEFRLREFKLNEIKIDIGLHYNDDFPSIDELIIRRLSEDNSKGIVLLHGIPGTGKTSYIRHLIRQLEKKLIYIPSNLASHLGDPEFLPFLVKQSGSILIIEDAEDILQERAGGDNGTMANLLNLGDGLLSDCLNIQIICTFNAPLTRIDKALLRKGRVIASYEFKPLTIEKSNALLKSLNTDILTTKELTLAEVFYQQDVDFMKEEGKGIGFGK